MRVLPFTHQTLERLRQLPVVSIAQIEGYARGGGSEVSLACDRLMANPASERVPRMRRFLDLGCQTPEGERSIGADCTKLAP